jgi:hypothetical protein
MDISKAFKAKWSRIKRSQPTRDASLPSSSASSSPLAASVSPAVSTSNVPQIASCTHCGPELVVSLTNASVVDPTSRSDTGNAPSAPVCIADSSTRRVGGHPSSVSPKPSGERNVRKPFVRLPSDRKDDELKILVYSYVMPDSPSLRLAVQVAGNLAELVQASFCAYTNLVRSLMLMFRNVAQRLKDFAKLRRRRRPSSTRWSMSSEKAGTPPLRRTPGCLNSFSTVYLPRPSAHD